jgi:NADPH:quinone reductase-like Zn-dependent oxidoreductase
MRAFVWTRYGPPSGLELQELAKPSPKPTELLIRIRATTVTAGDAEIRSSKVPKFLWLPLRLYMGLTRPRRRILGQELAGEVESVGRDVKGFGRGDQVLATTGFRFGAYAEYVCLPEKSSDGVVGLKPANLTYEEAAAVPTGGLEALHLLKSGRLQTGTRILINGAGGSIGTFAVQLAKYYRTEVTGVDSLEKLDMLRSIGADQVIDFAEEDFTRKGQVYDVILDVTGRTPLSRILRSLKPNGRCLLANPRLSDMVRGLWISKTSHRRVVFGASNERADELRVLTELIETGNLRPVIDRIYPFEKIPEAHSYVDGGHKKGNVAITVA